MTIFQLVVVSSRGVAVPTRKRYANGPAWYTDADTAHAGAKIENAARRATRKGVARVTHVGEYRFGRRLSLDEVPR